MKNSNLENEMELVTFDEYGGTGFGAGTIHLVRIGNNFGSIYWNKEIARAAGFKAGDRVNLMAMKDGSAFMLVKSDTGMLRVANSGYGKAPNRINSTRACLGIIERVVGNYGKEITEFTAKVSKVGELMFYPKLED